MTTFTAVCPVCKRVFENTSQGRANANLANHKKMHFKHDKALEEASKPTKRKYTKRASPVRQTREVKFCPECGCNLHAVKVALSL